MRRQASDSPFPVLESDRAGEAELPLSGVLRRTAFRVVVEQKITQPALTTITAFLKLPIHRPFKGE